MGNKRFMWVAMNEAIRKSFIPGILILLLLGSVGCVSQKSVDDLSKQLADVDARLTKLEQAETARSRETSAKDKNNALLDKAIADAAKRRQDCKASAELDFNDWVRANGTRAPGKAEVYTAPPEALKQVQGRQDKAEADCQQEYENAVKAGQLKYPQ